VGNPRQLNGGEVEVPSHVYVVDREPSAAVALLVSVKVADVTGVVVGGVVTAASPTPPQATSHSAACSATTGRQESTGSGSRHIIGKSSGTAGRGSRLHRARATEVQHVGCFRTPGRDVHLTI